LVPAVVVMVVAMAADPAVTGLEMVDMAAVTVVAMAADPAVTGPEMVDMAAVTVVAMAADPVVTALDKVARLKAVVEGIVRALARVPVETAERLVIVGTPVE